MGALFRLGGKERRNEKEKRKGDGHWDAGDSFQAGLAVQVLEERQQPVGWWVVRGEGLCHECGEVGQGQGDFIPPGCSGNGSPSAKAMTGRFLEDALGGKGADEKQVHRGRPCH